MKGKVLKKAALGLALGACLASMAPLAMAQSATGAVAGRASAGDQIMITNTATGATRSVTVGGDGGYRLSQLPVGDYQLQVKRNGEDVGESVAVNVALGGTTTVNLGSDGGVVNLNAVLPDDVPDDVEFAAIWSNPPIRIGKAELHALLRRWLPRLGAGATAWLVVQKNLGADSLHRWLADDLGDGWHVERAASSKGFRVLAVTREG